MSADWRFVRRPIWLVGHVVVIVLVVTFVTAGFWQLRRQVERNDLNAVLDERFAAAALTGSDLATATPEAIEFRTVVLTGVFDGEAEVILALQSLNGSSGHRVLTPLVMSSSAGFDAVIIDRGWVPIDFDQPGNPAFAPPPGEVTVTGIVRRTQTRGRRVPETGEFTQIGRVDVGRLQQQMEYDLAPFFVHLTGLSPPSTVELPLPAPLPGLDPGSPHVAYAVQWFVFATIGVVGYGILLSRRSMSDIDGVVSAAA